MERTWLFTGLLWLIFVGHHSAVCATTPCRLTVKAEENGLLGKGGSLPGPAVLFSTPVVIPAFRLRFVDSATGKKLAPSKVSLAYGWRWLEYPYPEHSWGAWSEASDLVECMEPAGEINVPEFEVRPRGWYDGKYVKFPFSRKPSFTGVGVVIEIDECTTRATISPKESLKLKGQVAVFSVNCRGGSRIRIQRDGVGDSTTDLRPEQLWERDESGDHAAG